TVTLTGRLSTGSTRTIDLLSSDSGIAQVPVSVTIPQNQYKATFQITVANTNADTSVTITATDNSTATVRNVLLNVTAPKAASVTASPNPATGGTTITGTVKLTGALATADDVDLDSSNTGVATVPPTVSVLGGQSSAKFTITAGARAATGTTTIT